MRRSPLALTALITGVTFLVAQEKTDPKAPPRPNYYPLVKGHKWEFQINNQHDLVEAVSEVVKVENKDGVTTATIEIRQPGQPVKVAETIRVTADKMTRLAFGFVRLPTPVTMLKFPVTPGDSWTEKITIVNSEVEVRTTVREAEELKLPAGTFKAVPVVMEYTFADQKIKLTNWYADGVGIVKQMIERPDRKVVSELRQFIPAKAP